MKGHQLIVWFLVGGLLAIASVVIASGGETCAMDAQLVALETRDPVADAQAAIARGDRRFVGVLSLTLMIPGVAGSPYCWEKRVGVMLVPDTTDGYRCEEHRRLQDVAKAYARSYNATLLQALRIEAPGSCAG